MLPSKDLLGVYVEHVSRTIFILVCAISLPAVVLLLYWAELENIIRHFPDLGAMLAVVNQKSKINDVILTLIPLAGLSLITSIINSGRYFSLTFTKLWMLKIIGFIVPAVALIFLLIVMAAILFSTRSEPLPLYSLEIVSHLILGTLMCIMVLETTRSVAEVASGAVR